MQQKSQLAPLKQNKTMGKYVLEKVIGSGGFATVYLGYHTKTQEKYAIKVIDRNIAKQMDIITYVENELRIFSRLNHPNIVKVYDIIYTDESIWIVMEYMANGDLHKFIDDNIFFNQSDQIRMCLEILEALSYIHQRGISHRDIKPANIMFDKEMHAKLIDFGFSRENSNHLKTCCGTAMLMAPEVVCNKEYDGMKSDLWSFGVTMHIMANHKMPFDNYKSESQFIHDCKKGTINFDIRSQSVVGWVIKSCLAIDPSQRPTAPEMLEYIKNQTSPAAPVPLAKLAVVKRLNTCGQIAKVKIHSNTPVLIRTRPLPEHNSVGAFPEPKQVRSNEN